LFSQALILFIDFFFIADMVVITTEAFAFDEKPDWDRGYDANSSECPPGCNNISGLYACAE
jgi:hypothetical protein